MYDPVSRTQQPIVIGEEGVLIGDVVAAQPRKAPANIADQIPGVDVNASLYNEGVGILNIRSVYDVDGVASVNIRAIADPQATGAAQRPARFLRVEKAVSIPDEDIVDLDNTDWARGVPTGVPKLGFYSHVDVETRRKAEESGFDLVVPRSRMAREMPALVDSLAQRSA
jgi:hypothetical protein